MPRPALKAGQAAAAVLRRIRAGDLLPGQHLPPERELAAACGVNRLTLRRALALLAERGAIVRSDGRRAQVAGPPAGASGQAQVAYVGAIDSHFFKDLALALGREAQRAGRRLVTLSPEHQDRARFRAALAGCLAESPRLICLAEHLPLIADLVDAQLRGLVVVGLHEVDGLPPCHAVWTDRRRAALLATEHLAALGHRAIAFLGRGRSTGGVALGRADPDDPALQGHLAAMQRLDLAPGALLGVQSDDEAAVTAALGQRLRALRPWPTAVVCDMDYRAVSLYQAVAACGRRCPDDVSVIGLGDTPWCEALRPSLTSVGFNEAVMAQQAMLLIDQPRPAGTVALSVHPRLVPRASAAAAR